MALEVTQSGFLALIQDYGRYGYQGLGVTTGGALDEHAFLWANRLLGNDYNAPQIEISYGVFSAVFTRNTTIAICGADLSASINDEAIVPWRTYTVHAGDVLRLTHAISGLRTYLAVKGGFVSSPHLSSYSTVMREGLGGLEYTGEKLAKGDLITYKSYASERTKQVPPIYIPSYDTHIVLRFIPNTSRTSAGEQALQDFIGQDYQVTRHSDRMGYRLAGKAIETACTGIISQGISVGAIQLPADGQPIVLMKDRQTMGGYPLLGCIAYMDIAKLAQSAPGTQVSFVAVSASSLVAELIDHKQFFNLTF